MRFPLHRSAAGCAFHPVGVSRSSPPAAVHAATSLRTPTLLLCAFTATVAVLSAGRESLPVVRSALAPIAARNDDLFEPSIREHERAFSLAIRRWVGAAPFGVERPVPPRATTPIARVEPASAPGPAPAPAAYAGPRLTAILGSVAFFEGTALRVGESGSGLTLVAIEPDLRVKVRHAMTGHEPGEYAIRLWPAGPSGFIEHEPQNRR